MCDRGDAVHAGHVEVDDDGVGLEPAGELDCLLAVVRDTDHGQLGLALDQLLQRGRVALVVIRQQNANRTIVFQSKLLPLGPPGRFARWQPRKTYARWP